MSHHAVPLRGTAFLLCKSMAGHVSRASSPPLGDRRNWRGKTVCAVAAAPDGGAPAAQEELFSDLERPEEPLRRAEALPMMIQALKFFPTNVYNDMFDDVIGHEWYAGAVECAWQNGLIPPEMAEGGKFLPEKEITLAELLAMLMNGFRGRMHTEEKELPGLERVPAFAKRAVRESAALGLIDGTDDLNGPVKRGDAALLIRRLAL